MYKSGIIIILTAAVFASCNRPAGTLHGHALEEVLQENASNQLTLYSEQFEYFIEYGALHEGENSVFRVYVTILENYQPLVNGNIRIHIGNAEANSHKPINPGIFELQVVPSAHGEQKIVLALQTAEGSDQVHTQILVSEAHQHEDEEHAGTNEHDHNRNESDEEDHLHEQLGYAEEDVHGDHKETHDTKGSDHTGLDTLDHVKHNYSGVVSNGHLGEGHEKGEIIFSKEQAWRSDFMVRELTPTLFSAVITASGQILAIPGEKRHLPARSNGVLVFYDKDMVQGSHVEAGQPLFMITATSLGEDNIELRYRELRNNLDKSRSEYRRHQLLFEQQVIPERQLIASRTTYENDSLQFYNLAQHTSDQGLKIISPISGYIHELNFSEGQYVQTGDQLVTISSDERLLLRADVPMQHYQLLQKVETSHFRTGYSDRIYDVEELEGRLLARGSSVAENNHFIPLYFEVKNDGTLLEGAFVEYYLRTRDSYDALTVPAGAVAEEQGVYYCYVQMTGNSYSKKQVKTGATDGRFIEIISGLQPGERIVTEGVMLVKAASLLAGETSQGHDHAH